MKWAMPVLKTYSHHMDGLEGEPPYVHFLTSSDDFLIMIDESHMTMGQIKGM